MLCLLVVLQHTVDFVLAAQNDAYPLVQPLGPDVEDALLPVVCCAAGLLDSEELDRLLSPEHLANLRVSGEKPHATAVAEEV